MEIVNVILGLLSEEYKQKICNYISILIAGSGAFLMSNIIGAVLIGTSFYILFKMIKRILNTNKDEILMAFKEEKVSLVTECYVQFQFKNGCFDIRLINLDWAPITTNQTNKLILSFSLPDSNKKIISITPYTNWKQLHFQGSLAIIEMWDIKEGNYKIEFN